MTHTAPQSQDLPLDRATEQYLWLPPHSLCQYQWKKVITGLVFAVVFCGWMVIQWSHPAMRWVGAALVLITAWVTLASTISDYRRSRGRQLRVEPGVLSVTTPRGTTRVALCDVADAEWQQTQHEAGLWLYDTDGGVLAHLDRAFLADQTEALAFLGWARQQTQLPFKVRWPQPEDT